MSRFINIEKALIIEALNPAEKWKSDSLIVKKMTHDNMKDAAWFNSPDLLKRFSEFLFDGHLGYLCYKDNVCIFRTWIFTHSKNTFVGTDFVYRLRKDEVFSGWSETAEEYRGYGAFSFTLNQIIHDLPTKLVSAYVAHDNIGSIKGTHKTGFEITKKLLLVRIWKLKISIQYRGAKNKRVLKCRLGHIIK